MANVDEVLAWFKEKNIPVECPICNSSEHEVQKDMITTYLTPLNSPTETDTKNGYRFIAIICKNCAYVRLFSSTFMGITKSGKIM